MTTKNQRQLTIKEIITKDKIGSQEELLDRLVKKGFSITQATLSRDLRQMKAARVPDDTGGFIYVISEDFVETTIDDARAATAMGFRSIQFSGNMGVIKTLPAYSHTFADLIDRSGVQDILGTVAGNDTVFIVLREKARHENILKAMKEKIPELKGKL